ncbi:helix-turn-helix domain-containing protein [Streptomyces sp. NPDC006283]|uniref:helix-turn-helix domain-containing protein n=1 Tax=Streptomyces sp. NPDC006283 TaxID=3156741 RepID=UPI0033B1BF74
MLESLGLDAAQEQVYVCLLRAPAADAAAVSARTGLDVDAVTRALSLLETDGLVSRPPGRPSAYHAAPPDVTLNLMVLQRLDEFRRVQLAVERLAAEHRALGQGGSGAEPVEVLEGAASIAERYRQIQRGAREVSSLVAGPAVVVSASDNTGQRDALRAGVRYRAAYERATLEVDSADNPLLLEEWAALGEEMRVTPEVPLKLVIADRRIALALPRRQPPGAPVGLVVRTGILLEALNWLFDRVWATALPVPAALPAAPDGPLTASDRRLLSLLLSGCTDRSIASQWGVSMRTVQRRVQRLIALAGVQTRLQLGWQAARLGWIEPRADEAEKGAAQSR